MSRIPEHIIEQVRQAHAIDEIVGRTVELKKAGVGFKGLCPFHDEKTPSFTVSPSRQTYKCFGCGKGGNVFTFLTETLGLNFPEAVRMLAEERGIQVPRTSGGAPGADRDHLQAIYEALRLAQKFFAHSLTTPEGAEARAYLTQRGYDQAAIEKYGIGFAPPGWDRLLSAARERGVSPKILMDAGLAQVRTKGSGHYDRFRGRVTFPISDLQGRVVTFGARALSSEDNPKYLNGPETDVFKKSNVLYALDRAQRAMRDSGEALLMEGYTDVLMAHIHGFETAVAGMGTALTDGQARKLNNLANRVVMVYDSDSAGQAASERGIDILIRAGLEVRVAALPPGRDVDEILLEDGQAAFAKVLSEAVEYFEYKLAALAQRFELATPRGRASAIEALVPTVSLVPSDIERDQLFRMIGERLGGGPETEIVLRRAVAKRLGNPMPRGRPSGSAAAPKRADSPARRTLEGTAVQSEIVVLLSALDPALRDVVLRAVGPDDFQDPVLRRLYEVVLGADDEGDPLNLDRLSTRTADDAEAASTLAALDLEGNLEDALDAHLRALEGRRKRARQADELMELARQFGASGRTNNNSQDPGKTPQSPDPQEQWPAADQGDPEDAAPAAPEWNPEVAGAVEDPAPPELEPDPYLDEPRRDGEVPSDE